MSVTVRCPHCLKPVGDLGDHLRDVGELDTCPPESCPTLFDLRRGVV